MSSFSCGACADEDLRLRRRSFMVLGLGASSALLRAGPARANEVVGWPALLLPGWNARAAMDRLGIDSIEDGDPRANEVLRELRADWDNAPPNPVLDGRPLRMWGYMIPLTHDASHIREFLLVPHFGACLHEPAPPANQVVHVKPAMPFPTTRRATSAVWVSGRMRVARTQTDFGVARYRMSAAEVEPYKV